MRPVSTWTKKHILLLSVGVALLPLFALLVLANAQAKKEIRQDVAYIASDVLEKTEATLGRADQLSLLMAGRADEDCRSLRPMLVQTVILEPAIRSITLWSPTHHVCSSVRADLSLEEVHNMLEPLGTLPVGASLRILPTTRMLPGSPVLVFARQALEGGLVLVTIEGNYLSESLGALERWNQAFVSVQVRGSPESIHGGAIRKTETEALGAPLRLMSRSYPVQVSVGMHADRSSRMLIERVWRLLPYALVLSLIVGYLAYRILMFQGSLMAAVGRGIRQGQFYIVYQPIVQLESCQPRGMEALMRWESRQHASLSPELLFAIAEEMELGLALTRHVFGLVAKDVRSLPLPAGFLLHINVSPNHLMGDTLESDLTPLLDVVADKGIQLVLEVTERTRLVDEAKVLHNMSRLREHGVQFALDDFGAAHNSLSYLERYAFDFLKVDKQFVAAIQKERFDHAVLDSIITLAKRLSVTLVAEGIETERQRVYLGKMNVELGQGYYFTHPMAANDVSHWLARQPMTAWQQASPREDA